MSEKLAPDGILEQTGLSGALSSIQDDPQNPDANWWTAPGSNTDTTARVSFPTPSEELETGAGLQTFRVWVRKTNHATDPSAVVELAENGTVIATLVGSTTISSASGQLLTGVWDATARTAANIECNVVGTVGGGNPGNRASVEVGAIEWEAATQEATAQFTYDGTVATLLGSAEGTYTLSGPHFYDGAITALVATASGTLDLTGPHSYDGAVQGLLASSEGTLQAEGPTYTYAGTSVGLVAEISGTLSQAISFAFDGAVTTLLADASGAVTLSGPHSYTGQSLGHVSAVSGTLSLSDFFGFDGTIVGLLSAPQGTLNFSDDPAPALPSPSAKWVVFVLPSVEGRQRWVDYLPVKIRVPPYKLGKFSEAGCVDVTFITNTTGLQEWVHYTPVFNVNDGKAWSYDDNGYIPIDDR